MTAMTMPTSSLAPAPAVQLIRTSAGSVAAVTTTITRDRIDGDVDIVSTEDSVELTDNPRGLGWLLPGELRDSERTLLNDELAACASRHPRSALVLERLLDRGDGELVHIEARLVPLQADERDDLSELLGDSDRELASELGRVYAEELHSAWAANPERPPLQVCFLEDADRTTTFPTAAAEGAR